MSEAISCSAVVRFAPDDPSTGLSEHVRRVPYELRRLAGDLYRETRLGRLPETRLGTKSAVLKAYAEDCADLTRRNADTTRWLEACCEGCLAVHRAKGGKSDQSAVDRAVDALRAKVPEPARLAFSPVTGAFAGQPIEDLLPSCRTAAQQATCQLVRHLVEALEVLLETEHVGIIRWDSRDPEVCSFHYFMLTVTEEHLGTQSRDRTATRSTERRVGGYVDSFTETETLDHYMRVLSEREEHLHTLIEAREAFVDEPGLEMPDRVRRLVDSTPSWLARELRVVVGRQVGNLVTTRVEGVEEATVSEAHAHTRTQWRPDPIPVFYRDPALVLGPYVLTGWADQELGGREGGNQKKKAHSSTEAPPRESLKPGAHLAKVNLRNANLHGMNLASAHLLGADLSHSDLTQADLKGANLIDANLEGADLSGADLLGANLNGAKLTGATLIDARLDAATLCGSRLKGSDLSRATFSRAQMAKVELCSANLRDSQFVEAVLCHADLTGANLQNACLEKADLRYASLTGSNLHGATLAEADLTCADLTDANLAEADFSGVCLTRTILRRCGLSTTRLTGAKIGYTEWPEGFNYHAAIQQPKQKV